MKPRAWYNEIDPYAAQWLRNLIAAGLIPDGDVDERSIADVQPNDLVGYTQCHMFAGLGGWAYALRLADWPDDRPVWTGSCPCQPFSSAGKQAGFSDSRHLWPQFRRLIAERRPAELFGEQVAGAADWLRLVRGDLEEMGYAVGAIPMEAASAGADHYRDRYWFVADCNGYASRRDTYGFLAQKRTTCAKPDIKRPESVCAKLEVRTLAHSHSLYEQGRDTAESDQSERQKPVLGPDRPHGSSGFHVVYPESVGWGEGWTEDEFRGRGFTAAVASINDCQYIECPDGKWRRLPPPRVRWLGHGLPARVARLRAFGNAIDPRPAQIFIEAYMSVKGIARAPRL